MAEPTEYLDWITRLQASIRGDDSAHGLFGSGMASDDEMWARLRQAAATLEFEHFPLGNPFLADHVRRHYAREDQGIGAVLSTGASAAFLLVCRALLPKPGADVLVETPVYGPIKDALRSVGAKPVYIERRPEKQWNPDVEQVRNAIHPPESEVAAAIVEGVEKHRPEMLVLTNPHNPSGFLLDPKTFAKICRLMEHGTVVVDEVFLDWVPEEFRPRSAVNEAENVVAVSSLTKPYGLHSLRCGWVLAREPHLSKLREARISLQQVGSDLLEALAVKAFEMLGEFEARTRKTLVENIESMKSLIQPLIDRGVLEGEIPPYGGLCFLSKRGESTATVVHRLKKAGVYVTDGRWFGDDRYFRVGYGGKPAAVRKALRALYKELYLATPAEP